MFEAAFWRPSSAGPRFSTEQKADPPLVNALVGNIYPAAIFGGLCEHSEA
jgi:hypothetical protein